MKRFVRLLTVSTLAMAVACGNGDGGDDDGGGADAGGQAGNPGFIIPTGMPVAYTEQDGVWTEVGPANLDCSPANTPLATDITVSGTTNDFQTGDEVDVVNIAAFGDPDDFTGGNPIAMTTSDADATFTITIPAGTTRVAFRSTDPETPTRFLNTYLMNQYYTGDETGVELNSVSHLTANALPAFIGVMRTEGLGVLAGAFRDCDDNEVGGVIATVSTNSCIGVADCEPQHLDGAATYYFSAGSTSLPVRLTQQQATNKDGLFVVIELPPSASAYLQVWGYTDMSQIATGDIQLLAEIPAPVLADSVITASLEPLGN